MLQPDPFDTHNDTVGEEDAPDPRWLQAAVQSVLRNIPKKRKGQAGVVHDLLDIVVQAGPHPYMPRPEEVNKEHGMYSIGRAENVYKYRTAITVVDPELHDLPKPPCVYCKGQEVHVNGTIQKGNVIRKGMTPSDKTKRVLSVNGQMVAIGVIYSCTGCPMAKKPGPPCQLRGVRGLFYH